MNEIWKDIQGFEYKYRISSYGNVESLNFNRSGKSKLLTPCKNSNGYLTVNLYKNSKNSNVKVHKLVAIHFLNHKPCNYKEVVNHIDFDKSNNKIDNLELISQRENSNQKHIESVSKYVGVSRCRYKWRATMSIGRKSKHIGVFETEIEASNAYQKAVKEITKN